MPSHLSTLLGLNPSPSTPSHASTYLIIHFLYAYAFLSSRPWKLHHKLDHNVSPRDDLLTYGAAAVKKGRLTQRQLDRMRRVESCHANSVEHYPLFVAAMVLAEVGGVQRSVVNLAGLGYTVARVGYSAWYVFNDKAKYAVVRGVFWWTSNIICLRLLWKAGVAINAKVVENGDA